MKLTLALFILVTKPNDCIMKIKTALLLCAFLSTIGLQHVFAQNFSVSGKITSQTTNDPLAGVTVSVKGTSTATTTDKDGNYTINVPKKGSVLVITYTGMGSKETTVNGTGTQNFSLSASTSTMDEVVVIGYGQQKKSLNTGAISSIKADQLTSVSNTRIEQALQGRIAGVYVAPSSGQPGAGLSIRIRGTSSNRNNEPLYVIDGVKSGGIESLDPSEIASVEVLKDAGAASIYGSEGGNGVVLITTKKGRRNSSEITYSVQYGTQSVKKNYLKMMNAPEYAQYLAEANISPAPSAADLAKVGNGTDWEDVVTQTAPQQHHSLSFSGGNENSTYFVGGNIFTQEGIVGGKKAQFKRYTVRFNSENKVRPWLSLGNDISFSHHTRSAISDNTEFGSILASALVMDPITPVTVASAADLGTRGQYGLANNKPLVKDENGNYYGVSDFLAGEYGNPAAKIAIAHGQNVQNKIFGNVHADLTPFKDFKFTTRFGIDAAFQTGHNWTPTFWFSDESQNTIAAGSDYSDTWNTWIWENFASYNKKIKDHNIGILVGASVQKSHEVHISGSYSGLFKEQDKFSYADGTPDLNDKIYSIAFDKTLASFFGRLSYDFKNKYLLNFSLRRDGSSLFAPGYQWGTFPAVSAGWVFTKENFFPAGMSDKINYGKLRASWGQNGNLSSVGTGEYLNSISGGITYPTSTGGTSAGAYPTSLPNYSLHWETGEQFDAGLDLVLLKNRVNFTVDYYNRKTKDLLTDGAAPFFAGAAIKTVNAGDVSNKGWEFDLSYKNLPRSKGALSYEIGGNISFNKNKVTYLDPNAPPIYGPNIGTGWVNPTGVTVGEPIWFFRGYKTAGIFQNQKQVIDYLASTGITGYNPKPGDVIVVDVNGDKLINGSDFVKIGTPHPKFIYGARVNLAYKGFDLFVFLQGQYGNDMLMGFIRADRGTSNKPEFFFNNRWTGDGSTNDFFAASTDGNNLSSDKMVFDASFARIRQLQLGYTLPATVLDKAKIRVARLYVSLDDFFTFTKYPGTDPEVSNLGNSLGVDRGGYPVPRKMTVGLSFTF